MDPLLAQVDPNSPAYKAGMVVGVVIAALIFGGIPLALGLSRGRPALGVVGGLVSAAAAALFGIFGGLPAAGVFAAVILALGNPNDRGSDDRDARPRRKKKRSRPAFEVVEEPEDDDRPRRRRRDD